MNYPCIVEVLVFERGEEVVEILCVLADYRRCSGRKL